MITNSTAGVVGIVGGGLTALSGAAVAGLVTPASEVPADMWSHPWTSGALVPVSLGYAVLHAITRGMAARPFVLAGAYAAVPMFAGSILVMSMLGLAESAFNIRARFGAQSGPSSGPTGGGGRGPPSLH